jgi:hypothetical protein
MKKIYLSILSLAVVMGASAQQTAYVTKHGNSGSTNSNQVKPTYNVEKAAVVWSDDFSTPANWTMTNTGAEAVDWTIETDPSAGIPNAAAALNPFMSASAANGFAVINSDGAPGNADGNGAIVAQITTATAIDLTATPNAILRFSHNYRWWQESRVVRVSGDGGTTWTEYPMTYTVASGNTFPNGNPYPNNQNSDNPQVEVINISAVAGGSNNVLIQFAYDDADFWGWYWAVDDVEILEQPTDDIQVLSAWFSGTTNGGTEYGRTPLDQIDTDYLLGAEVYNFGVNDQTGIALAVDYNSAAITSASTATMVESDSTIYMESTETPTLAVGMYNGTYTAISAMETGGAEFGNNVYERNFEITTDVYSIDGLGNQPASTLTTATIGTASFTDAEDGLVVAALYQFKNASDVSGIRVMLDANSVAGGEIYGSIKDTATFWASDMTSLFNTSVGTVTATDISNGYIDVWFPSVINLTPGVYYAAVELYSNANASDVVIVDDVTVAQPSTSSAIYIPGDQSYTNGTGIGVRMLTGNGWGVGIEENTLEGVSIYPNPSQGIVNVSNDNNASNAIVVYDMLGQVILTKEATTATTLDLSGNGTGVYLVEVSNDNGSIVERVVIK